MHRGGTGRDFGILEKAHALRRQGGARPDAEREGERERERLEICTFRTQGCGKVLFFGLGRRGTVFLRLSSKSTSSH